jgi:phosphotransferase system HPr-like phosphotransfer protein
MELIDAINTMGHIKYIAREGVELQIESRLIPRQAYSLSKECQKYSNEIMFSCGKEIAWGRSLSDLLGLKLENGSRVNVFVEDLAQTKPQEIMNGLCKLLTSFKE